MREHLPLVERNGVGPNRVRHAPRGALMSAGNRCFARGIAGRHPTRRIEKLAAAASRAQRETARDGFGKRPCSIHQRVFF
jgi:hypothetical protein